jgi:hypothetical protein
MKMELLRLSSIYREHRNPELQRANLHNTFYIQIISGFFEYLRIIV